MQHDRVLDSEYSPSQISDDPIELKCEFYDILAPKLRLRMVLYFPHRTNIIGSFWNEASSTLYFEIGKEFLFKHLMDKELLSLALSVCYSDFYRSLNGNLNVEKMWDTIGTEILRSAEWSFFFKSLHITLLDNQTLDIINNNVDDTAENAAINEDDDEVETSDLDIVDDDHSSLSLSEKYSLAIKLTTTVSSSVQLTMESEHAVFLKWSNIIFSKAVRLQTNTENSDKPVLLQVLLNHI
jgi:hypothetical protein